MGDEARFGGVARLYGGSALDRLARAHVAVIGVGGVGSWTVEARFMVRVESKPARR